MKNFTQRFAEFLMEYFGAADGPGNTIRTDYAHALIRACLVMLNQKITEGFDSSEEEENFFRDALPLYISLSGFILRRRQEPHPHWVIGQVTLPAGQSAVCWTGSKAEAVELIYELTHVGVLNHGRISTLQTTKWFEQVFQIELGNVSKIFQDIRNRKKETASLAGRMDKALLRYIDQLDHDDTERNEYPKRA